MKKIAIISLIAVLMATNGSIVHAASNDNIEVSLTSIKDIMIDNSQAMKIEQNNLDKTKEQYKEAKDAVDEKKSDVDNIKQSIASLNSTSETYASDYKTLKDKLDKANEILTSSENTEESTQNALNTARITYEQKVENLVYNAQQDYISYLNIVSKKESNEEQASSNDQKLQLYKLQYDSGFISKKEYDSDVLTNTKSSNGFKETQDQESFALQTLRSTLGIEDETKLVFNNSIQKDFEDISKIDFNSDLADMLDNNYNVKLQENKFNQLNDSDSSNDYDINNAEISLGQDKINAELAFKKQYNTLMNSYNSIKSNYDSLDQEEKDYNVMETQYSYGFVSKNKLSDKKLELDKQKTDFTSEQNQFYLNYLRYMQMKEGC